MKNNYSNLHGFPRNFTTTKEHHIEDLNPQYMDGFIARFTKLKCIIQSENQLKHSDSNIEKYFEGNLVAAKLTTKENLHL